jgi:hypothetical protein
LFVLDEKVWQGEEPESQALPRFASGRASLSWRKAGPAGLAIDSRIFEMWERRGFGKFANPGDAATLSHSS